MKSAKDAIQQVATQIAQKIYSAPGAGGENPGPGAEQAEGASSGSNNAGEKVVDADYTVVDEDKK